MATLTAAHKQWAERPADETFSSLGALHAACVAHKAASRTATVDVSQLRAEANGDAVQLVGRTGQPAKLTNWAFGQLATRAEAPPAYLRTLPATLAAQNLNYGLARYGKAAGEEERKAKLLFRQNGDFTLRACLTEQYTRIWNSDVSGRLVQLTAEQPAWKLPLAYDRFDGTRGTPNKDGMVPRGAYCSDRDLFVFLVDEEHPIAVPGSDHGLKRGFFVWNSEVGAASLGITTFLYDYVCGNHYVWGASNVTEIRVRHVGNADQIGWGKVIASVRQFANRSASEDEQRIEKARTFLLGATKDAALDALFGKRIAGLSQKRLDAAYAVAEKTPRYGDPRSAWAMASGLTELSQECQNTDDRVALDRAAGKVLEIAF